MAPVEGEGKSPLLSRLTEILEDEARQVKAAADAISICKEKVDSLDEFQAMRRGAQLALCGATNALEKQYHFAFVSQLERISRQLLNDNNTEGYNA